MPPGGAVKIRRQECRLQQRGYAAGNDCRQAPNSGHVSPASLPRHRCVQEVEE